MFEKTYVMSAIYAKCKELLESQEGLDPTSFEQYEELMEFSNYVEIFWEKEYRKSMTRCFLELFKFDKITKDNAPMI
jgi:hypothetical protein